MNEQIKSASKQESIQIWMVINKTIFFLSQKKMEKKPRNKRYNNMR